MVKTLVEDAFADDVPDDASSIVIEKYEPHNILYGSKGWTDALDDATIDLLVRVGAVTLDRTVSGVGFETRIYVSVEGNKP